MGFIERSVPVWFYLLSLLCWALISVGFGWAVKTTVDGTSDRAGAVGEAAVAVASFPTTIKTVVSQLEGRLSGSVFDVAIRVNRESGADYSGFVPVRAHGQLDVQGLLMRTDPGRARPGWRLLTGGFLIDGSTENAAVLLSPALEIVKVWTLDEVATGGLDPRPGYRKFVHGMEVLHDGSLIFTFDGSISLQRVDWCGNRLWATPGDFHHAVSISEDRASVWTFSGDYTVAEVAVADGRILRSFSADDIIRRNPAIDILELRRFQENYVNGNPRATDGTWLPDPVHFNDVEPLPAAIAGRFEDFDAGDLLISARSLNLIFVIDPGTLKIKWWRTGATLRQHDPDWLPNGRILVFNNRMGRDYSEIVSLDPASYRRETVFDGRRNGFYSRVRGKSQLLDDGTLVVASAQQGRAFEVSPEGDIVLELVNTKPGSSTINYAISEMRWLPADFLNVENWSCSDSPRS